CHHGRAPRKGDRDRGAEAHAARVLRRQGEWEEGLVTGLGGPEAVEAQRLGLPCDRRDVTQVLDGQVHIDLHERAPARGAFIPQAYPRRGPPDGPRSGPGSELAVVSRGDLTLESS